MYLCFALCTILVYLSNNYVKSDPNKQIYVPSAPQNLMVRDVKAHEIQLIWTIPSTKTTLAFPSLPKHATQSDQSKEIVPKTLESKVVIATTEFEDAAKPKFISNSSEEIESPKNDTKIEQPNISIIGDSGEPSLSTTELGAVKGDDKNTVPVESVSISASDTERNVERRSIDNYYFDHRYQHRHRKRRQDEKSMQPITYNVTVPKNTSDFKNIRYVLYYEQGIAIDSTLAVESVPSSEDVKNRNNFGSDGMTRLFSYPVRNVTLNPGGALTGQGVRYTLRGLKSFTPYKIWVRAFYASIETDSIDVQTRLGPKSTPVYVMTDVRPPSEPYILDASCQINPGSIYIQWQQPKYFDNSLDGYIITLKRLEEAHFRTKMTIPTSKSDQETAISLEVEMTNDTEYEIRVTAATKSIAYTGLQVNGTQSEPQILRAMECGTKTEARAPDSSDIEEDSSQTEVVLVCVLLFAALAGLLLMALYWRSRVSKCISATYSYLEAGAGEQRAPNSIYKKHVNCSPAQCSNTAAACPTSCPEISIAKLPRMCSRSRPALTAVDFTRHVANLHQDGDIGFSKEYETVCWSSESLPHTSHHSQLPENKHKNRYLNITAYDHSRVCVSTGTGTEYVNANFIDGILPRLDEERKAYIRRKLTQPRPKRNSSQKSASRPPQPAQLLEGESAFLNIEFSGIVESELESDSDNSSDGDQLDDIWIDLDGERVQVKLEWLIWKKRYIATQGPTPSTTPTFWRMIWQHNVTTIVMITNLVERGRRKCDMYWPQSGTSEYGGVKVTLVKEDIRAAFTLRQMCVSFEGSDQQRTILQYHYTVWPDHGTPAHPLALLPLVKSAAVDDGIILVHCSAGVGRTGTYIVLDAQLAQLELTGTLAPLGFLCRARTQRNYLVQTEEQYIFVHDAILEHVRSGNTAFQLQEASQYFQKLLEPISQEELEVLEYSRDFDMNESRESLDELSTRENGDISLKNQSISNNSELMNGDLSKTSETRTVNGDSTSLKGVVNGDCTSSNGDVNGRCGEDIYDLTSKNNQKSTVFDGLSESDKDDLRRVNLSENHALIMKMRKLSSKKRQLMGPPPVNLLEKQYQLITRCFGEPSENATSPHNVNKNRPGGVVPSDASRVMLVPKPAVEGSDYINASWVSGRRRLREFAVAQHPTNESVPDIWRMLWDHTAQLLLVLTDMSDPECPAFYPTPEQPELLVDNFRVSLLAYNVFVAHRKVDRCKEKLSDDVVIDRQESSEKADEERLIPDEVEQKEERKPDRTELRLENLSFRDPACRKSIANGDIFSSMNETRRSGARSPKSPSKMSLKSFKLSSPTRFKFPEWSKPPPEMAPPPIPNEIRDNEAESCQHCYEFEKLSSKPEGVTPERIIEVFEVTVHSLRDDYQLSIKIMKCSSWMKGEFISERIAYNLNKPFDNEYLRDIVECNELERPEAMNRFTNVFGDAFALVEFVAGRQMEYRNGPVVIVDKYGGWRSMCLCTLCGVCNCVSVDPPMSDIYCAHTLLAHARVPLSNEDNRDEESKSITLSSILAMYAAIIEYSKLLYNKS